jgi:hypothetical protein
MSNIYALTKSQSPVSVDLADVNARLRKRIAGAAHDLLVKLQHRRATKRFERFSAHRLQDLGFEQDWDGSIQPFNR